MYLEILEEHFIKGLAFTDGEMEEIIFCTIDTVFLLECKGYEK